MVQALTLDRQDKLSVVLALTLDRQDKLSVVLALTLDRQWTMIGQAVSGPSFNPR